MEVKKARQRDPEVGLVLFGGVIGFLMGLGAGAMIAFALARHWLVNR